MKIIFPVRFCFFCIIFRGRGLHKQSPRIPRQSYARNKAYKFIFPRVLFLFQIYFTGFAPLFSGTAPFPVAV